MGELLPATGGGDIQATRISEEGVEVKWHFHLPFSPGITYPAGYWFHAVVTTELQEAAIPFEISRVGIQYKDPGVLHYQLLGCPTELPQPMLYSFKGRCLFLVEAGKVALATAKTKDKAKDYHPGKTTTNRNSVGRPVKFTFLTQWGFITDTSLVFALLSLVFAKNRSIWDWTEVFDRYLSVLK